MQTRYFKLPHSLAPFSPSKHLNFCGGGKKGAKRAKSPRLESGEKIPTRANSVFYYKKEKNCNVSRCVRLRSKRKSH